MSLMTDDYVIKLFAAFSAQEGYLNRLSHFEKHFHVIFDLFPAFDYTLTFLNDPGQIGLLTDMYRKDSSIYAALKKEFSIDKRLFVFDVRPVNSYRPVFNKYIIDGFVSADRGFNAITGAIEKYGSYGERPVAALMDECDQSIRIVRDNLQKNKTSNFRIQFMTVFYEGYNDHLDGLSKSFRRKKKFIELYLYSQGLLFAGYRQRLQSAWLHQEIQEKVTEPDEFKVLDWRGQVLMLKKMGMLDVLKDKIQHPVETVKRKKIHRIICQIIGQQPYMTESITEYINLID
jgi:hypothetical protein